MDVDSADRLALVEPQGVARMDLATGDPVTTSTSWPRRVRLREMMPGIAAAPRSGSYHCVIMPIWAFT